MVDEHARQLVAHRLVDEQRRDGRVDPARERAQHALRPHLHSDPLHLLLDHRCRRPRRRRVGHRVEEVLQQVVPVRGVHDLGVELDAVQPPLRILERRDRGRLRRRHDARTLRRRRHRVAVTHPADLLRRQVHEQLAALGRELGLAVADAERRDPELEDARIDPRRAVRVDRGWPARENERQRVARTERLRCDRVRDELRVDTALAHAPRDQLGVLATTVQNEHRPLFCGRLGGRERDDFAHQPIPIFCACCSDFPSVLIDGASMISAFWKSWIDS